MLDQPSAPLKNSSGWKPWDSDEILQEVYRIREERAAAHGYDLHRILADLQRRSDERLRWQEQGSDEPFGTRQASP